MRDRSKAALEGILVAAVTPREPQEYSIDLGATLELVDFLGERGANGIALLGSTGEFVHFGVDDRCHMVNFAAKRSRLPLLVNVSHSTLDGAVHMAREAAGAGVAGVLLMPPYYFRYSQDAIVSFYRSFAAEIGDRVPIYLYNIPCFNNEIGIAAAKHLLGGGEFAGIKDSSGSLDYFAALREQAAKTPFDVFVGDERIYARARSAGAQGAVSGVACALPELMAAIEKTATGGARDRLGPLETRLAEFMDWIEPFPAPAGIKAAVRQRGLKVGALAVPLGEETGRKLAQFAEWFQGWLPEVLRECSQ